MKQSAAKTLGVAVLGAAFAATAAGTASASVVPVTPDVTGTLGSVTSTLPLDQVTSKIPAGKGNSVQSGQHTVGGAKRALQGSSGNKGLLGGLPTGTVTDAVGSIGR
ncbi:ATP-binding protein [Streptomyces sp. NPDC090052]|uniref:ATP-binding protein n=1 Tax=unclassified Streptomyces TaxID=2593676 RepID=UPI00225BECD3|nr:MULTISPECIES: ATP-binding protein [unclassified Streptomyces]MCX4724292.1 ATP-binding protein [Streptomyces sp. NBC_01306]WSV06182.1 ATP-binding protein [Streptomyces sp. NBC_01020]WSX44302.1 ATP-binding protein [Streptomyces sp. NBC_00963]WSX67682.1 ATP-binding protein [Streptomyces sp. NBC_00932]